MISLITQIIVIAIARDEKNTTIVIENIDFTGCLTEYLSLYSKIDLSKEGILSSRNALRSWCVILKCSSNSLTYSFLVIAMLFCSSSSFGPFTMT